MNEWVQKIIERCKSSKDEDILPTIPRKLCHGAASGNIPVVLFGVGSAGGRLCNALMINHVPINCFCDNNRESVSNSYSVYPVISVNELEPHHRGTQIVITTWPQYAQRIHNDQKRVYQKRGDFFESLLFIHRLHPGYKFYLRHHSATFSDAVLFAIAS